jgi:hypothetical protein
LPFILALGQSAEFDNPAVTTAVSEVPSIGSLEIRLDDFLKESEAAFDRIAESD